MKIEMIKLTGATRWDGSKEVGNRRTVSTISEYEALREQGYVVEEGPEVEEEFCSQAS